MCYLAYCVCDIAGRLIRQLHSHTELMYTQSAGDVFGWCTQKLGRIFEGSWTWVVVKIVVAKVGKYRVGVVHGRKKRGAAQGAGAVPLYSGRCAALKLLHSVLHCTVREYGVARLLQIRG